MSLSSVTVTAGLLAPHWLTELDAGYIREQVLLILDEGSLPFRTVCDLMDGVKKPGCLHWEAEEEAMESAIQTR